MLDVRKTVEHVVVPSSREDYELIIQEVLRQVVLHAKHITVEQLRRKPQSGVLKHRLKPADTVEFRN
jgi:hypothetical protein